MEDSDGNFKRKKRPKEEIDLIHKKFTAEDWNFLGELYDEYLIKFHIKQRPVWPQKSHII